MNKLWGKLLKFFKKCNEFISLSCQSAANLKKRPLHFWVSALRILAQQNTQTQMETQLNTHNWTHRFRHTFGHTLLWTGDRSMTEIVTYTSNNISKTQNINTAKHWAALQQIFCSKNYIHITYSEYVIIVFCTLNQQMHN